MPLSQVQRGMHCTALSVIHGTDISSFDTEVLDVIAGDAADDARILIRVSGPAVDDTGIGPGFSGSPIYCPDGDGVQPRDRRDLRGDRRVRQQGRARHPDRADARRARSSRRRRPGTRRALLRRAQRAVVAADHQRRERARSQRSSAGSPAQRRPHGLRRPRRAAAGRPGARAGARARRSRSATPAATSARGAIGTVTYVDGDRIWGFGHPLDSVGRRDLFLQGAYVYDIVNNPLGIGDVTTYKLAAPTQDIGTLLGDGIDAVTGRTGPLPDSFPLTVFALDQDTGNRVVLRSQVADETAVGNPSGASPASGLAAIAAGQATYEVLRGSPARQSGSLCMHITIAERAKPMGFCNTYVGGVPGEAGVVGVAVRLRRQPGHRPPGRLPVRAAAREVRRAGPARAPRPVPGVPRCLINYIKTMQKPETSSKLVSGYPVS